MSIKVPCDFKVVVTPERWNYKGPSEGGYIVVPASRACNLHAIMKAPIECCLGDFKDIIMKIYKEYQYQRISEANLKVYQQYIKEKGTGKSILLS